MADQIYKVRDPSGAIREISGPAGATDEQVIAQAQLLFGAKEDTGKRLAGADLIPKGGDGIVAPEPGKQVVPISGLEAAIQGAMAVPVIGGIARGAQLLSKGSRVAPYAARLAEAVIPKTGVLLAVEGAAGAVSGLAAKYAAEVAPSGYEEVGGMLGGALAGGVTSGIGVRAVAGAPQLFSGTKDFASQVADKLGKSAASRQSIEAITANPNLTAEISRAAEIKDLTGINLPMLAASGGDTTISSYLQQQISLGGNAKFTAAVKQQYEQAERELLKAKSGAAPSMIEVDAYVKRKATDTIKANEDLSKTFLAASQKRTQGIENIDARIAELSREASIDPGKTDVGFRLSNLVESKAASIRAELSPKYSELIKSQTAAGIKLPGDSAKDLRSYATDEINADVFSSFPELYRNIKRVFKPESKASSGFAEKYPGLVKAQPETFRDYSLEDMDSLKRNVNKAIRESKDIDKTRRLYELKKQVDTALDTVDPSFSVPYRALDAQYAERLGIPFSQAGVTKIDRARFVEDTVPVLTSRSSSLKQALGVIGDSKDGLKIIDDAFLFDISTKRAIVSADGVINSVQLKRYIKEHGEQLDLVPDTRKKLENLSGRIDELMQNRTRILEAEKSAKLEKIENLYTEAYGSKEGIRGIVRRSLSNQQELDKLLAISANDKVAREGLKSAIIDDLTSLPGNRMDMLAENREAITKVFGSEHMKSLDAIVEASQRLKDNPMVGKVNINTISKTDIEKITGTKLATSVGEMRNQVISMHRVFINHVSRFFEGRATKSESAEIQKFLLDSNALKATSDLYKEIEVRGFTDRAIGLTKTIATKSGYSMLFGGALGAAIGAQVEEKEESKIDSELLQGFKGKQ